MCSPLELQEILSQVRTRMDLIFNDNLKQIILYGSYARGDHKDYSDIDIMVVVDMDKYELTSYRDEVWNFAEDVASDYGYEFVLSLKLQDEATFLAWNNLLPYYKNVLNEGVVING